LWAARVVEIAIINVVVEPTAFALVKALIRLRILRDAIYSSRLVSPIEIW
jgi:hypothetical protein